MAGLEEGLGGTQGQAEGPEDRLEVLFVFILQCVLGTWCFNMLMLNSCNNPVPILLCGMESGLNKFQGPDL